MNEEFESLMVSQLLQQPPKEEFQRQIDIIAEVRLGKCNALVEIKELS